MSGRGEWAEKKAVAFCPIEEASCALIRCALLARPPKATALRPMAEKTCGSAASAFIAALSLANWRNATAFAAICELAEAFEAAAWNALALEA